MKPSIKFELSGREIFRCFCCKEERAQREIVLGFAPADFSAEGEMLLVCFPCLYRTRLEYMHDVARREWKNSFNLQLRKGDVP